MAKFSNNGSAQTISTQDFNERAKRLLAGKVYPQPLQRKVSNFKKDRRPVDTKAD
ncbi:hypothetical protein [Methylobacterium sp. A54F]